MKPLFTPPVLDENTKMLKNSYDAIIYYGLCIGTFGFAFLLRLVITTAIKKAK